MLPLRNYRSDILTPVPWTNGVNSRQCDSRRSDILRWYHVNKYRTTRENWWSELEPARKSSRRHVNTPWNTFYCGNCRQANQIRGFNKQNLSSKHEKGIPQCIFIFFFSYDKKNLSFSRLREVTSIGDGWTKISLRVLFQKNDLKP